MGYYVEVYYATKRGGHCVGMDIEAFSPDEAQEIAEGRVLKGYPARKWHGTKVRQGEHTVISMPLDALP